MALEQLEKNVIENVRQAFHDVGELVFKNLLKNSAVADQHTLEELAAMGHPYSKKRPQVIHDPNWQVHTQSGNLLANTSKKEDGPDHIIIGVDGDTVPYLDDLIYGTKKMIARPFISESFHEVEDQIPPLIDVAISKSIS